jgi:type II secretion system protein N
MMNSIILFFKFLFRHSLKFTFVITAAVVFILALFPLGDLSDLVSNQVLNATQNSVYVQFKDLSFNPATMTLRLNEVELDTPVAQEIKFSELSLTPSILDLISKKPSGVISAEGFLGADNNTRIELKSHDAITDKIMNSTLSFNMTNGSLNEIHKMLQTPMPLSGQLIIDSTVSVELENRSEGDAPPAFALKSIQDGDISILIKKFKMPATSITVPQMGRLGLPLLEFNNVELKAKIQQGKITIESGKFGSPSDELFGTIRGDLTLLNPIPPGTPFQFMFQSYNVTLEISAKQAFKDRGGFFLALLKEVEKDPSTGLSRYQQTFTMNGVGMPPNR